MVTIGTIGAFIHETRLMLLNCVASTLCAFAPVLIQTPTPLDSVNRYVTAELERQRIPGISVAILRGDQVLLSRGYGFANFELRVPASDSTIYQSGSLGKHSLPPPWPFLPSRIGSRWTTAS